MPGLTSKQVGVLAVREEAVGEISSEPIGIEGDAITSARVVDWMGDAGGQPSEIEKSPATRRLGQMGLRCPWEMTRIGAVPRIPSAENRPARSVIANGQPRSSPSRVVPARAWSAEMPRVDTPARLVKH
ncbi:hypothetical protein TA3x_001593 [Tundrisphaera sp. TA3]|uniref:hypothetical protein n=1 Tax=Tundrisphaera sp. TA3 TaxID=3435775 RepID=UPI003EBFEA67